MKRHRLLFVCLGNICRSPIAEGVFAHIAAQAGKGDLFEVDSAGTGSWHIGDPPDPRAVAAAARRGIDLSAQRARQLRAGDFDAFDLLLAMDRDNRSEMLMCAPAEHSGKVALFLDGVPEPGVDEVPDPYYGGNNGFEEVLDLVEAGAHALLARLS